MKLKNTLKMAAIGAIAAMSLALLAGCGSDTATKGGSGEKTHSVGIVQLVEHNALDAPTRASSTRLPSAALSRART